MENVSRISLKHLYGVVRFRWRAVALVALAIFAGLAAYILSLRPEYTSEAVVLLAPVTGELDQESAGRGAAMTDPFFIRSETSIVAGDGLSRAVIERLGLAAVAEFLPQKGFRERLGFGGRGKDNAFLSDDEILFDHVLQEYKDRLSVFNDGRSKTVSIGFAAADPRLAANIANAHAQAYLQEQSTRRLGSQQETIEWLRREVDARAEEVRQADAQVQQYQLRNGIVSTHDSTIVEQRLSQLSAQLVEARRQLSGQMALLAEIRQIRPGGDSSGAATLLANEPLKNLLRSRVEAEADIAALEKRLAANHPTLIKRRQELASISDVLNQQLQRLESEAASSASWWERQVKDLTAAVNAETSSKFEQDLVESGLPALTAQSQVKRTVFETVLNRYQTLLAERGLSAPAASIVTRAMPAAEPSSPRRALFLVIAAMVAMLGGVVTAIALQLLKPTSMGVTAMADAVGIRPLVAIPHFRNASQADGVIRMADPRLYIESVRFLRDAILERQQTRQTTTCLVTSVLPRQGKSLVAMSLARALARSHSRTLFMEVDLRRPTGSSLARRAPPEKGLAAVLEGRASLSEVIVCDESTGLEMLLAEARASSALDRLTTAGMSELLKSLRERYDVIVIDSPPVGLVSDALALVPLVDHTIMVAKDGETSIADLKRGIRLLHDRGATMAGLVLTGVDPNGMSSVDRKTLHHYVMGVPAAMPADAAPQERPSEAMNAYRTVLRRQRFS